jgi:hypothetical protein
MAKNTSTTAAKMLELTWSIISTLAGTIIEPYRGRTAEKYVQDEYGRPKGTGKMTDSLEQLIKWTLNHIRWEYMLRKGQYKKPLFTLTYEGHTIVLKDINFTLSENDWDEAYLKYVGILQTEIVKRDDALWEAFQMKTTGKVDASFNTQNGKASFVNVYLNNLSKSQEILRHRAEVALFNPDLEAAHKLCKAEKKQQGIDVKALVESLLIGNK